jgi:hypothetical protein
VLLGSATTRGARGTARRDPSVTADGARRKVATLCPILFCHHTPTARNRPYRPWLLGARVEERCRFAYGAALRIGNQIGHLRGIGNESARIGSTGGVSCEACQTLSWLVSDRPTAQLRRDRGRPTSTAPCLTARLDPGPSYQGTLTGPRWREPSRALDAGSGGPRYHCRNGVR